MIAPFTRLAARRRRYVPLLGFSLAGGCAHAVALPLATPAECEALRAALAGSGGDADSLSIPVDTLPREILVRYRLTAAGRAEAFRVLRGSGNPAFDRTLVRAFSCATFEPARGEDGRAVTLEVEQPIVWRRPPPAAAPDSSSGVQGRPQR